MVEYEHLCLDADRVRTDLDASSWIDAVRGFLVDPDGVFDALRDGVDWQSSQLFRYDHFVEERRLAAGWRRGTPLPHPALADATRWLQHRYRVEFPSFTMIRYRDGDDGQGFHRDTEMKWLDDTIIAVLTLGATRPWQLRPYSNRNDPSPDKGATHELSPAGGDLLVMGGRCQADWQHSVPYLPGRPVGERISIQWRFARKVGRPYSGTSYADPLTFGQRSRRRG